MLFYRKDTFTMGPQGYCANSLSSLSEISIAFCYFTQHTPAKSTAHLTKSAAHFVSENKILGSGDNY